MTIEDDETGTGPRPHGGRAPRRYDGARMLALSDGVFAFAITLLVLDLVVPTAKEHDLFGGLIEQWPQFLAYIVSFATIGALWLSHNSVTEHLAHTDSTFMRLNLLLLLVVSFMPFPTRFVSTYIHSENPERAAVTLYGVMFLAATAVMVVLWSYARRAGLLDEESSHGLREMRRRLLPGLVVYVALIILGLFVPLAAVFGYFAIAVFFIVPIGRLRHRG